jgi:putative membrane protein
MRIFEMNRTTSTLLSLGVSIILIAFGVWFLCSHGGIWPESGRWMMGHHNNMGWGMGIVMIIFWVLLIAAFVLLISGAVNGIRGIRQNKSDLPNSIEILGQRYARGEIDKAEYEEKRRNLII